MTPKQRLRKLIRIDERINAKQERLERLQSLAEKVTTGYGLAFTQGGKCLDRTAEIVCNIVDLIDEINSDIDNLVNMKRVEQAIIDKMQNSLHKELLELRYIDNKTWEQVALIMHYTIRAIYYMHGRALQEYEECSAAISDNI